MDFSRIWLTNRLHSYLNFAMVDDIEVVALIALLNDRFALQTVDGEHRIENVGSFVFIQMGEEHIFCDGF